MEKLNVFLVSQDCEEAAAIQENEWDCWIEGGWAQF